MRNNRAYLEQHYCSADNRLNLFARDYSANGLTGEQLPLLMMHGLTRNSADFEPLVELLGGGRRMIVPDQRGRGRSEYDPDPANYRPDVYVADMWALLDVLGIERVVCIGTSMGGLMSMIMGAVKPDRVAGIVLNDIGPVVAEEGLDRIRGYVGPSDPAESWEELAARCKAINGSAAPDLDDAAWLEFAKRTGKVMADGRIGFDYDPAIAKSMEDEQPATVPPDLWPVWDALKPIPMLVIRGGHSDILTADTVVEMKQRREGELEHIDVPNRGHAPLLDEPLAVEAIRDFLLHCE